MFALKDLIVHARRIASATQNNQLEQARYHASMLVGRDTDNMDTKACNRAAVESASESLVDSVIAPLFFLSIFGMAGLITFKIFSTMDSMVGYRSKEYLYFGWFGARMDDVLNFLPARVTWLLITIVSIFLPGCSPKKALLIGFKQHSRVPGPNAGWSECSVAGALKIRLAGPIWRDGKMVTDIWIGDPNDPEGASNEHIEKVIQISFGTTLLFLCLVYWSIFNLDFYFWFF